MNFSEKLKRLFNFGQPKKQFFLGDEKWQRPKLPAPPEGEKLDRSLAKNRARLEAVFDLPTNKDIVIRDFTIPSLDLDAFIVYTDGLTDRVSQSFAVLQPLMLLSRDEIKSKDPVTTVFEQLLPNQQVQRLTKLQDVIDGIMDGNSILFLDKACEAVMLETKGWEHRGVGQPSQEPVVRGPQEAFTETFRASTAAVRRLIKDPKLITEIFRVGQRSKTLTALMYIKDIANPQLVEEIKYRIQTVAEKSDYISESGALEELIEDHPKSIFPQLLSTERPDRLAAHLREGYVGVVMANSPFSLIMPTTFTIFLHAAEDYYLRWPFGNFLRIIRALSIFMALLLPAAYIAVVNFHQEMIPTDLMLAMTAARENVPFPALAEIIFMEFAFELIREAGVRVPSLIGPTLGIVGALILGQAAVAASIVSPVLIIIIALTALASFVVPNYNASFSLRLMRFIFVLLAAFLGFFGMAFGGFIMLLHLANLTSFGIPFLAPFTPYRPSSNDRIIRPRNFEQTNRPLFLRTLDWIRQSDNPRPWDQPEADDPKSSTKEPTHGK